MQPFDELQLFIYHVQVYVEWCYTWLCYRYKVRYMITVIYLLTSLPLPLPPLLNSQTLLSPSLPNDWQALICYTSQSLSLHEIHRKVFMVI